MHIYGYKLPDDLYALIKGKELDDLPAVSVKTLRGLVPPSVVIKGGFHGKLSFFSVSSIIRESDRESLTERFLFSEDLARDYGLTSSKKTDKPIDDINTLDIDKALFIAGNYDEETIALDYSFDATEPLVLGWFSSYIGWVLLATSFTEFAEKTDLIPQS